MPLAHVGAASRGVPQQQIVERVARHLPRLRLRHLGRDGEVGVSLDAAVGRHERRAPFLRKARLRAPDPSAPIAASTSLTDASSDSPMWKRGNGRARGA